MLVDALHNAQREQLKKIGVMTDDAPLKVSFRAPFASRMGMRVELSDDISSLEFSPDLAGILGFDADMKYSGHNNNNNNNNNNRISIPPSVVTSEAVKDDSTGGRRRVGRQNVERICQTSNSYGYKKERSSDSVHSRDLVFVE